MLIQVKGDVVKLYGRIWEGDGVYISNQLERLEGNDWLIVRLHTIGGSVIDGEMIFDCLSALPRKIHIIVEGLAASMGPIVATSGDKISIRKNSFMMIHEPQGGARGTSKDLKSVANVLDEMKKNFIDRLVKKTGKTKAYVTKWMDGDNWFSATQALKEGLVDDIMDSVFKDKDMNALRAMKITASCDVPEALQDTFSLPEALNPENHQAASEQQVPQKNNQNQIPDNIDSTKKEKEMKQALIEAFKLQNVTAESSDTVVIEAMRTVVTGLEKKVTEGATSLKTLQDKEAASLKASIASAVSSAIAVGKIDEKQRATYEAIGTTSGLNAINNVFEGMTARTSLHASVRTPGGAAPEGIPEARKEWAWDKWQTEDPRGLEALADSNKEAFEALGKAKYGASFTA